MSARTRTMSYAVTRTHASLTTREGQTEGEVWSPHGIVSVQQYVVSAGAVAYLHFIHRRRTWRRIISDPQAHTHRGLSILAARFARDVVSGKGRP